MVREKGKKETGCSRKWVVKGQKGSSNENPIGGGGVSRKREHTGFKEEKGEIPQRRVTYAWLRRSETYSMRGKKCAWGIVVERTTKEKGP